MRVASLKRVVRVGLCWCVAWPIRGRSCGRYASTRESGIIRQLSLQSKFLPSFRERYSPPNPESASIGQNLGWRNCWGRRLATMCVLSAQVRIPARTLHTLNTARIYLKLFMNYKHTGNLKICRYLRTLFLSSRLCSSLVGDLWHSVYKSASQSRISDWGT